MREEYRLELRVRQHDVTHLPKLAGIRQRRTPEFADLDPHQ